VYKPYHWLKSEKAYEKWLKSEKAYEKWPKSKCIGDSGPLLEAGSRILYHIPSASIQNLMTNIITNIITNILY